MKYNYQKICTDLLKGFTPRTANVIERRFGLQGGEKETLEAIGATYGITRERVRQIEVEAFAGIKEKIKGNRDLFKYFAGIFISFGGLKKEDDLLKILGEDKFKNHISFLLTSGEAFTRIPEDNNFHTFWVAKKNAINSAKKVVKLTIENLNKKKKVLKLNELLKNQSLNRSTFVSYIDISKNIQMNHEQKYGLANWIEINPKGIKDKAYIVFKKQGKPVHFTEVASLIENLPFPSQRKVHNATVHNELIKDSRFVLVGRGLYALKEWGYQPGIVRDVIVKTLQDSKKPLSKQEILQKVLDQRFVKENTVLLNLQNKNYFLRDSQGKYTITEA